LLKTYVRLARDPKVTLSTGGTWTWPSAPSMASFSSRGPNDAAPDVLKPDLVAPGMQILAGDSPVADPSVSAPGQLFQAISGTSMAGPIVAGMFALLKQEHPDWTPARLRSALMTTADTDVVDNDRRRPAGPFAMGAGMVDPGVVAAAGSAFNPGIVYDAGAVDYLGFLCGEAPQWFASFDVGVTCDELAAGGVSTTATDLNTPSIAVAALPGTTTVTRTITSVASKTMTWWAAVKAPPGYRVTVSPSRLTLAPGASASFTVTFTNTGRGKVGAWTTGAMTWKSGWFTARSALAVRGSALDVPADVDGSGTSGSLTFAVKFGYTGTYTATAHGLVAPTTRDGTVEQDPDAKFPSADDAQGGVAELPVTLAGVDHARWTLRFAPGDPDDLDMYLYDSAGHRVAVSGNVGTDEQIDLDQPADGDYTLVVHGFHVTEPEGRAFTVQQWLVPLAPSDGSNFEITDAPASATVATAADVVLAWHDLQAGTGYLGTVTHADATGTIQTTLVDIAA
jgi:hypothetical protein